MLDNIKRMLRDEIINDPLEKGYEGKTSEEVAAMLNNHTITIKTEIYKRLSRRTELIQALIIAGTLNDSSLKLMLTNEFTLDPLKIGYAQMTAVQKNTSLDMPREEIQIIETKHLPRWYDLIAGVENAPHTITIEDIKEVI